MFGAQPQKRLGNLNCPLLYALAVYLHTKERGEASPGIFLATVKGTGTHPLKGSGDPNCPQAASSGTFLPTGLLLKAKEYLGRAEWKAR